jgi:hypothetical protein
MSVSLKDWFANRWIVAHEPTREEVASLLAVVDRDLKDAAVRGLSTDAQLAMTYNAALQLATAALAAEGYRPGRDRAHERAILSLGLTADVSRTTVDLLDLTRRKRNQANYEQVGIASETEVAELRAVVSALRAEIVRWLGQKHSKLCPPELKS